MDTESTSGGPPGFAGSGGAPSWVDSEAWSHPVTRTSPSGTSSAASPGSGESTQPRTTGTTGRPDRSDQDAPPVPSSVTRNGVSTRYPERPSSERPATSTCPSGSKVPVTCTSRPTSSPGNGVWGGSTSPRPTGAAAAASAASCWAASSARS